jgi:hypothetical protein
VSRAGITPLTYRVDAGTGAYRGAFGTGTLTATIANPDLGYGAICLHFQGTLAN